MSDTDELSHVVELLGNIGQPDAASTLSKVLDELDRLRQGWDGMQKTIDKLEEELGQWHEASFKVMKEQCAPDEKHCTCVPFLRIELDRLRAENKKLREQRDEALRSDCRRHREYQVDIFEEKRETLNAELDAIVKEEHGN